MVFFDPEFQRWQLFQDKPGTGAGRGHRRHIQALLDSLRAALTKLPLGVPFKVVTDHQNDSPTVTVTKDEWATLAIDKVAWDTFMTALRASAQKDLLSEQNKSWCAYFETLEDWPNQFTLSLASECNLKLQSISDARDLISLLPILQHWDFYGAIREGWLPGNENRPKPPQSLWQEIGRLDEPFYCNHLIYPPGSSDDADLKSRQFLGYSIAAEAAFADLSDQLFRPTILSLRDCYDYAYLPPLNNREERAYYKCYALLMDKIQLALSPRQVSAPETSRSQDLYYLSYPVFSGLGRKHFLHLYVRPIHGRPDAQALFEAWRQLHQRLNWSELRHVLVDELEKIDLARFHERVTWDIATVSKSKCIPDEEGNEAQSTHYLPTTANHLHLLFPIHCACHAQRLGQYPDSPTGQNTPGFTKWQDMVVPNSKGLSQSVRCKGKVKPRPENCKTAQGYGITTGASDPIVWNSDVSIERYLTPLQETVAQGRRERLVNQQIEFSEMIWKSQEATRQNTKRDFEEQWAERQAQIIKNKIPLLDELQKAGGSFRQRFATDPIKGLLDNMDAAQFFRPFFYFHHFDISRPVADDSAWVDVYCEIARGSLHRLLSEYIETGVVRWLTHSYPKKAAPSLPQKALQSEYDNIWQRVEVVLNGLQEFEPLISNMRALNNCFLTLIADENKIDICAGAATAALQNLRHSNGRTTIGSAEEVLKYLLLTNTKDRGFLNVEKATLNVPSPAFGISCGTQVSSGEGGPWPAAIEAFRKVEGADSPSPLIAAIGSFDLNDVAHHRNGVKENCDFHGSKHIKVLRHYVLIGNIIDKNVAGFNKFPERFEKLVQLMSNLGETYWMLGSLAAGQTSRIRRVPDVDELRDELRMVDLPKFMPKFNEVIDWLIPHLVLADCESECMYEFVICALDGYNIA